MASINLPSDGQLVVEKTWRWTSAMWAWMRDITKAFNGGGGFAPANGEYVTYAANATLTAERVATSSATVTVNLGTANQIKWDAVNTGTVTDVTGVAPIASTGGTTPAISLNDTAVTPATYGDATHVSQFTVDQKGRLTFAANVAITSTAADYVVMSNGANPPSPVDDGAGNFIYVGYTP